MDLEQLIAAFDSAAGLEQAPAVDGVWKFSADGHVFGVTADDSGERVFLFGAVFSINPETGAYTLVQSERLDCLDPKSFFSFVEKFVNTLATWKGISGATQASVEASASDGVEGLELGQFGLMQV